jgi:tetratricopeptide (TPR) repeat protein
VYFLRSFRCYFWMSPVQRLGKAGLGRRDLTREQPACTGMLKDFDAEPVFEHAATNDGDWPTFDGYGDAEELLVGLYRVKPRQAASEAHVIPPGQDALISDMLGGPSLPAGCRLIRADAQQATIAGVYTCGSQDTTLELRHPSAAGPSSTNAATARTRQFSIRVLSGPGPEALIAAVVRRIEAREDGWRWEAANPGQQGAKPDMPSGVPADAANNALYERGGALSVAGKDREALEVYLELARKDLHYPHILGRVVNGLAAIYGNPDGARSRAAEADARPDDPLLQFIAGVSSHYAGHQAAKTREEKAAFYTTAIHYLERARPALDFEARLYIYLAVSHYRLGHQAEAEALIEKAVVLAGDDPDAVYCRAEVYHKKDAKKALADIEAYQSMSSRLLAKGAQINSAKTARVAHMHDELTKHGEATPLELFDPLPSGGRPAEGQALEVTPMRVLLGLIGGAGLVLLLRRLARGA